jgi:hypothetical protein
MRYFTGNVHSPFYRKMHMRHLTGTALRPPRQKYMHHLTGSAHVSPQQKCTCAMLSKVRLCNLVGTALEPPHRKCSFARHLTKIVPVPPHQKCTHDTLLEVSLCHLIRSALMPPYWKCASSALPEVRMRNLTGCTQAPPHRKDACATVPKYAHVYAPLLQITLIWVVKRSFKMYIINLFPSTDTPLSVPTIYSHTPQFICPIPTSTPYAMCTVMYTHTLNGGL